MAKCYVNKKVQSINLIAPGSDRLSLGKDNRSLPKIDCWLTDDEEVWDGIRRIPFRQRHKLGTTFHVEQSDLGVGDVPAVPGKE